LVEAVRPLVVVGAAAAHQDEWREALAIAERVHEIESRARAIEIGALVLAGFENVTEQREFPSEAAGPVLTVDGLERAAVVADGHALVIREDIGVLEDVAAHHSDIRR